MIKNSKDTKNTGLLIYFTSTFEKYYKNRLKRKFGNKSFNLKFHEAIHITTNVHELTDGYPMRINKLCLVLPLVDEFSQEDFLKKYISKIPAFHFNVDTGPQVNVYTQPQIGGLPVTI